MWKRPSENLKSLVFPVISHITYVVNGQSPANDVNTQTKELRMVDDNSISEWLRRKIGDRKTNTRLQMRDALVALADNGVSLVNSYVPDTLDTAQWNGKAHPAAAAAQAAAAWAKLVTGITFVSVGEGLRDE